jgi:hypothetical protein
MKKVALWYNILHKLDLLVKEEPEAEGNAAEPAEEIPAPPAEGKKKSPKKPKAE